MAKANAIAKFDEKTLQKAIEAKIHDPKTGIMARCKEVVKEKFSEETAKKITSSLSLVVTPMTGMIRLKSSFPAAVYFELGKNPRTGDDMIYPKPGGLLLMDPSLTVMENAKVRVKEADRLKNERIEVERTRGDYRKAANVARSASGWVGKMAAFQAIRKSRLERSGTPYQQRKFQDIQVSSQLALDRRDQARKARDRAREEYAGAVLALQKKRRETRIARGMGMRGPRIRMYNGRAVVITSVGARIPQGKSFLGQTLDYFFGANGNGFVINAFGGDKKLSSEQLLVRVVLKRGSRKVDWQ
jgi:hypothetical protein